MEPASAFMFFEQQYGELKEDFGLGGKGKRFGAGLAVLEPNSMCQPLVILRCSPPSTQAITCNLLALPMNPQGLNCVDGPRFWEVNQMPGDLIFVPVRLCSPGRPAQP